MLPYPFIGLFALILQAKISSSLDAGCTFICCEPICVLFSLEFRVGASTCLFFFVTTALGRSLGLAACILGGAGRGGARRSYVQQGGVGRVLCCKEWLEWDWWMGLGGVGRGVVEVLFGYLVCLLGS